MSSPLLLPTSRLSRRPCAESLLPDLLKNREASLYVSDATKSQLKTHLQIVGILGSGNRLKTSQKCCAVVRVAYDP